MSARSSWSGAILFAGFPIPVKAYNFTSTSKNDSFRTLCKCHGEPIKQANTCATSAATLAADEQHKGVEHGKGNYVALDAKVIEQINGIGKTVALEAERVCPVSTLNLHAQTGAFALVPEPQKGAEKPIAILWRVLGKLDMAIVTRWTPRAGSRDSIIAIHAGPVGLIAVTLPFEHQLSNPPVFAACDIAVADAEVAMFENALTTMYPQGDYAAGDFVSEHNARRTTAIEAAVTGAPVPTGATPAAPAVPDLMAALSASLAAVQSTPKEVVPA